MEPTNILAQTRECHLTLKDGGQEKDFIFRLTRPQIVKMVCQMSLRQDRDLDTGARHWLLAAIDKEQRPELLELINRPGNETLELGLFGSMLSFFGENQTIIVGPKQKA